MNQDYKDFIYLIIDDCSTDDSASLIKSYNDSRINFVCSDLFNEVPGIFDLIVANPPYVEPSQIEGLDPELSFEPRNALDGGDNGTELISKFIAQLPNHLSEQGLLALEVGDGQTDFFEGVISEIGFDHIQILKDLSGIERFILAMK